MFQENKARQIFGKTDISYPLIRTRTCTYQGVRMFVFRNFRKIWHALFSWNTHFEIRPFALLPTIYPDLDYIDVQPKFSVTSKMEGFAAIVNAKGQKLFLLSSTSWMFVGFLTILLLQWYNHFIFINGDSQER